MTVSIDPDTSFKALWVEEHLVADKPDYSSRVVDRSLADLPLEGLLIRVRYSSLNFKDAMSASGNKGVTRKYPHTPGIDAAGEIVASDTAEFSPGDQVIVIGYDLGMNTPGGFGQYIRVPAEWVVKLPSGLSLQESMIYGTAGFTAALCVEKLLLNGLKAEAGPVLVTGASGGVGSIAVALLASQGFEVEAMSGSGAGGQSDTLLKTLGAARVIGRDAIESSNRPLLKEQWAGAVDVVGGDILFNIVKSLQYGGSVACCGLVASPVFDATVFPFILRGVNLLGVDSVNLPLQKKADVWNKLASEWKLDTPLLESLQTEIGLDELADALSTVLNGQSTGRLVLNLDR